MSLGKLETELKKKEPFSSPSEAAVLNLIRTSDQFHNRFGRMLREHKLTCSQYNILRILRGEGKPLPCLEIASRMIQVVPAITGLIDRLEKAGFVTRERSQVDRRVVNIEITPAALKLLKKLDQPVLDLHDQLMSPLTRSEVTTLVSLLEKARTSLDGEIIPKTCT